MKNNIFDYIVVVFVAVIFFCSIPFMFTGCSHFKMSGEKVDIEISSSEVSDVLVK